MTESVDHILSLLNSKDIKDKATALTTINQLTCDQNDSSIIIEMFEKKIHCKLMTLLRPFKSIDNEEDCVEGEEDDDCKTSDKLSAALINVVLEILANLASNPDFFDDVEAECFGRIVNILKDDKYKNECQVSVYRLIETASQEQPDVFMTVADDIPLKLPNNDTAKNAFR